MKIPARFRILRHADFVPVVRLVRRAVVLVAVLALAFGAFALGRWVFFPAEATAEDDHRETAPETEDAVREYTCSMHPQVRTTDPNERCPLCGMELIPVPEDDNGPEEEADLPRLRVSERAAALMEVRTAPVRRIAAVREVPLYGRIDYDERRLSTITAWNAGRLEELHVDFTGQRVRRGEPMVRIYSPELIAAQEEFLQAVAASEPARNFRGTEDTVAFARDKLRLLGLPAEFIDELETSREVQDYVAIPAPHDGTVIERHATAGEYVDRGTPLYAVADLTRLWARLSVFESDLPWIREGLHATFTTASLPGETFEGVVTFVEPVLDERTRSVGIRLDVDNRDGRLRPGMLVRGTVHASLSADGSVAAGSEPSDALPLVIPASAPLITGRRAVVYVRLPDADRPTFEARDVTLGPRAGNVYIVRDGLDEDELVVVHGAFRIDSELQIRGRPSMMQPEGGPPPGHEHDHDPDEDRQHDPAPPADHDEHRPRREPLTIDPADIPDGFARQIAAVLDEYTGITAALAADNAAGARDAVRLTQRRLLEIDLDALDPRARAAWLSIDPDIIDSLRRMRDADDLAVLRNQLAVLSEDLAEAITRFAPSRVGPVYRVRCPMALDDAGADWLQRDPEVANPYFGPAMLRCGTAEPLVPRAHDGGGTP